MSGVPGGRLASKTLREPPVFRRNTPIHKHLTLSLKLGASFLEELWGSWAVRCAHVLEISPKTKNFQVGSI